MKIYWNGTSKNIMSSMTVWFVIPGFQSGSIVH